MTLKKKKMIERLLDLLIEMEDFIEANIGNSINKKECIYWRGYRDAIIALKQFIYFILKEIF